MATWRRRLCALDGTAPVEELEHVPLVRLSSCEVNSGSSVMAVTTSEGPIFSSIWSCGTSTTLA
jgi:hypothetical protein